jgi:phosphoribosyl-dephospho-CoA transferase
VRGPVVPAAPDQADAPGSPLRRHRLAWLRPEAWGALLRAHGATASADGPDGPAPARDPRNEDEDEDGPCYRVDPVGMAATDPAAAGATRACLVNWAANDRPLVVARQVAAAPGRVALGLPAPARWGRQRIALQVPARDIARQGSFPSPETVLPLLPERAREDWRRLAEALRALGVPAAVYGSYGWQSLTGLHYLHADSDIDLCLPAADAAQADRIADRLEASSGAALPRIDGELALPGGGAVAWREWRRWRAGGMAGAVLVKRIGGAELVRGADWLDAEAIA